MSKVDRGSALLFVEIRDNLKKEREKTQKTTQMRDNLKDWRGLYRDLVLVSQPTRYLVLVWRIVG
jgi:hypothetical protein